MSNKKTENQKAILQKAGNAGKDALLVIGGLVAGSLANKAVDKILKVDEANLSIKSFIAPVVTIAGGGTLAVLTKNQNLRLVGIGLAGSGVLKTVKVFLKRDILNGFSGLGSEDSEPIQLKVDAYNPDLPAIEGPNYLPIEDELTDDESIDYVDYAEVEIPVS